MSNLNIYYNINKIYKKYFKRKNKIIKFIFTENNCIYIRFFNYIYFIKLININKKMVKGQSSKIKKHIKLRKNDKTDDSHPRKGFSLKKR